MSIKSKLGMYGAARETQSPLIASTKFGSVEFTECAPFVLDRILRRDDLQAGTVSLAAYRPYRVSGILDLALLRDGHAVHPEDLLFLDTETTGLSRSVGTFPFLVGLGWFEAEHLVIRQILLTSPAGEKAFLDALQAEVKKRSYLVTYNGKSFDIPLIRNRLILQRDRLHPPVLHFDLFHILRRLFPNKRLGKYRQRDLEQELLGVTREGDIEGAQIPQIYFDYVKYGTDTGMESVVEHNRLDLEGMMLLFLEAVRIYTDRDVSRKSLRSGLARILAHHSLYFEALEAAPDLGELLLDGKEGFHYRDALFRAWLERRAGTFEMAADLYGQIAVRCQCDYSRLNLARILEYRLNRPDEAIEHVQVLLDNAAVEDRPEHERRMNRLRGKSIRLANRKSKSSA